MHSYKKLSGLKNVQSKVFDAFEKFIMFYNSEKDPGEYLMFLKKENDCIAIKVGKERFTIHGQINLSATQVVFKIFAWIFDLSKKEQYSYNHIDYLDFYFDNDDRILYKTPQPFKNQFDEESLKDLIMVFNQYGYEKTLEPFFYQLEKFTDKRLEQSVLSGSKTLV